MNNFQIKSLQSEDFSYLFEFNSQELEKIGAIQMIADKKPGFPCRISLKDAEIGEEVILLPYQHHQTILRTNLLDQFSLENTQRLQY